MYLASEGGSTLDCRSTGRVIDPAPGACFIPKFISLVHIIQYSLTVQNDSVKHHSFKCLVELLGSFIVATEEISPWSNLLNTLSP